MTIGATVVVVVIGATVVVVVVVVGVEARQEVGAAAAQVIGAQVPPKIPHWTVHWAEPAEQDTDQRRPPGAGSKNLVRDMTSLGNLVTLDVFSNQLTLATSTGSVADAGCKEATAVPGV